MKIINVLILFDLIYFVKSDTCNENWVLIEEKCVKFSSEKLTYHEAVEHCTNAGMYNNFILFFTWCRKIRAKFLIFSHIRQTMKFWLEKLICVFVYTHNKGQIKIFFENFSNRVVIFYTDFLMRKVVLWSFFTSEQVKIARGVISQNILVVPILPR